MEGRVRSSTCANCDMHVVLSSSFLQFFFFAEQLDRKVDVKGT